jgi:hypothetical protein
MQVNACLSKQSELLQHNSNKHSLVVVVPRLYLLNASFKWLTPSRESNIRKMEDASLLPVLPGKTGRYLFPCVRQRKNLREQETQTAHLGITYNGCSDQNNQQTQNPTHHHLVQKWLKSPIVSKLEGTEAQLWAKHKEQTHIMQLIVTNTIPHNHIIFQIGVNTMTLFSSKQELGQPNTYATRFMVQQ